MNVMLVILGFQVGYSYYPMTAPMTMEGFVTREACGAAALELQETLPKVLRPPLPESIHVPRMRWGCVRIDDAVR